MVFFNYSTMQMAAKVVYYGPGLCGKTTNLQWIFEHTSTDSRGEMVSLATETDRTLFFDLLPIDVGSIAGFSTRIQLYTVPGQVFYNTTRKLVLKGVDGVVFVADSQRPMLQANIESFQNLEENLAEMGLSLDTIPVVLQYNKRDLPGICDIAELDQALNRNNWPSTESSAIHGDGVFETLKMISKATLLALKKRLTKGKDTGTSASSSGSKVRSVAPKPPPPKKAPLAADQAAKPKPAPSTGAATGPRPAIPSPAPSHPGSASGPRPVAPRPAPPRTPAPAPVKTGAPEPARPAAGSAAPQSGERPAVGSQTGPRAVQPEAQAAPSAVEPPVRVSRPTSEVPRAPDTVDPQPAEEAAPKKPPEATQAPPPTESARIPAAAGASSTSPASSTPAAKPKKKKSRTSSFDALAELEKLRQETIRPRASARSNGKREINRDFRVTLKRQALTRAHRFSLILQLEDADQQLVDEAQHLHVDIDDAESLEKLLLRLNIALDSTG